MRAALLVATSLVLGGCGDNLKPARHDAAIDDATPDGAPDATETNAIGPCLDRPTHVVTAPSNQLPCELISPGVHP